MKDELQRAAKETKRLSRELDVTNADHIALWLEGNTIQDEPMSQCISWLSCRIVEAHERAIAAHRIAAEQASPTIVRALRERDQAVEALALCLAEMYAPEAGCSCHISPPCRDCVEYGGTRAAIAQAEATLAAIEGAEDE